MPTAEAGRERVLGALEALFDRLALREGIEELIPGFRGFHRDLRLGRERNSPEEIETALTRLYCVAHGSGGGYDPEERRELDRWGGYWAHAGGLGPLALAAPYIRPETHLADYGAGNGFQGLLLQHLYPHRLTTMIEISGAMIEQGRALQGLLGIPPGRVAWVHGNIMDVPPRDFDVVYLYRPVRPEGPGRAFYEMLAREAAAEARPLTILSVADCLRDFLPPSFRIAHDDGQFTIFCGGRA